MLARLTEKYQQKKVFGKWYTTKKKIPRKWLLDLCDDINKAEGRKAEIRYIDGCPVVFTNKPEY